MQVASSANNRYAAIAGGKWPKNGEKTRPLRRRAALCYAYLPACETSTGFSR